MNRKTRAGPYKYTNIEPFTSTNLKNYIFNSIRIDERADKLSESYINGDKIPERWSATWITSVHKKGPKDNCDNYILVTSTMSRLFGRVLKKILQYSDQISTIR